MSDAHTHPYVEFARTHDGTDGPDVRGTGVGRAMYLLAGRRLATTGRALCASGSQTRDAQRLWARLDADPSVPTGTLTLPVARGGTATWRTLDYRPA